MVPPCPETLDAPSLLGDISHKRISAFGKRLSVIRLDGEEFLIGVQIASLLKRETFNMYRSMKIKNISIQRANPEQVDFLCKCNAVRTGTHSVTLIPYEAGLYFIADAIARQKKTENFPFASAQIEKPKTQKSFIVHQPKLHRRKAHPWDVHRSIKKEELLLSGKNSPYADFDTPLHDIKAKQLAISKLHELGSFAHSVESRTKKTTQKSKSLYDPFNSLLFAAGSLEELEFQENSSSLNSSPSSSLNSSPISSPSYSPALSPQRSPSHPSQDQNLFTLLPQFNLGIFANAKNCTNDSPTPIALVSSF